MRVKKQKTVGVTNSENKILDEASENLKMTLDKFEASEKKVIAKDDASVEQKKVISESDSALRQKQVVSGKLYNAYQIMSSVNSSPYSAASIEEYKAQLKVMNLAEMQNHAMNLSIKPMDDRPKLEQRLIKSFTEFASTIGAVTQPKRAQVNGDRRSKALEILRAGK